VVVIDHGLAADEAGLVAVLVEAGEVLDRRVLHGIPPVMAAGPPSFFSLVGAAASGHRRAPEVSTCPNPRCLEG
jgi:hypothetical protein